MSETTVRTASFFDAMKSAFERPGEWWWRDEINWYGEDYDKRRFWMTVIDGTLLNDWRVKGDNFIVVESDLTATWTCDGSEP